MPSDYDFAMQLQREFDSQLGHEDIIDIPQLNPGTIKRKRTVSDDLNSTQNIVHPDWETIDPTPDVQALFGAFDTKFFKGKLKCVQLEWSKKMYQCAGICYYRRNQLGMSIVIRLSEPLLKLRQRKDLIETMLHEMIHAYLFVLNIREGNGGHGPNFKRIMVSINQTAGTNITVYHTFHDEVNLYKTHVWRCNGICQHRKPFFGYVRRTCNRAPNANDQWWAQHQQSCGGYFTKISGPEPKAGSATDKRPKSNLKDLPSVQRIDNPKWGLSKTGGDKSAVSTVAKSSTITRNPSSTKTQRPSTITAQPNNLLNVGRNQDLNQSASNSNIQAGPSRKTNSIVGGNLRNVIGFKDLNGSNVGNNTTSEQRYITKSGGHLLGGTNIRRGGSCSSSPGVPAAEHVRDIWSSRHIGSVKKPRTMPDSNSSPRPDKDSPSDWTPIGDSDDGLLIKEEKLEIIQLSDDEDDNQNHVPRSQQTVTQIKMDPDERRRTIKTEIMTDSDLEDDIILIDDDFDDSVVDDASEAADTSIIDDFFGTDTLLNEFHEINDAMRGQPKSEEIISCPICTEKMCRDMLDEHLNGCQGIKIAITRNRNVKAATVTTVFRKNSIQRKTSRELLADCGYTDEEIDQALGQSSEASEYDRRIEREMREEAEERRRLMLSSSSSGDVVNLVQERVQENAEEHECPVCSARIALTKINDHLDVCLSSAAAADSDGD